MASLQDFVDAHGLPAIGLIVAVEPLGIPLPAETVALLGGFLARTGHLSIVEVCAVASAAAIVGDNAGYALGCQGGSRLLARFGHWVLLPAHRVEKANAFYARHGAKAVLLERWLPGLRVLGPWTAGITHYRWRRFLAFDAITAIAWGTGIPVLGFALGASWQRVQHVIGVVGGIVVAALVVVAMLVVGVRHLRRDLSGPRFDELVDADMIDPDAPA